MVKNFRFHERYKLSFRTEAFNLFNRVNLGNPASNLNNLNTVAQITSAGDPRVIRDGAEIPVLSPTRRVRGCGPMVWPRPGAD